MNGMDDEQVGPQSFLYGCELKSGKEVVFNPEDDDFDHQLDLRMVCVDQTTSDELNIVEVEGQDTEGQKVKAVLASLKPSTLPCVCLSGFGITPPAVFRLKSGSGPIHISGQHLVVMGGDQTFDEEDDEEEEELVQTSKKRPASAPALKSKRIKMDEDVDEEDDDEDDDDDDEEESEPEPSPVKPKKTPSKAQTPAQNGKTPKANTPAGKQPKTPDSQGKGNKKPQTPKTPQAPLSVDELKAKMAASVGKGVGLPKLQPKFENFLKLSMKVTDTKIIQELWKWRQTLTEKK
ncbi:nucleophosmin 1a isoform X2 [Osmerus eperlanus]|uniref:nucleophosmin 1a isoform X2 n=1 Tax=Osmerus eperlanus TaxID=29151 RepID=UPI002E10A2E9